jgi:4-hydroxy-3-polyprenylbenzoate decarboxylase
MKIITEAGGIICPASPSFYSHPATTEELLNTVIDKLLKLAGFEINGFQWGKV